MSNHQKYLVQQPRWRLFLFDFLFYLITAIFIFFVYLSYVDRLQPIEQIANGGPVTITDKRIPRFFMTIPEANQRVMTSGAMAKNGELYVLDMGRLMKTYDLAEEMIRLSGLEPYKDIDIVETGLRPGEKLYEELLIRPEEMDKTDNDLIFIERDKPLSEKEIQEKLEILKEALATGHNTTVKEALMKVIPTYHSPEEVNRKINEQ